MVWLTERGVFALLRLDTDYFAAMYSYTITFGPVPFGPVTCNRLKWSPGGLIKGSSSLQINVLHFAWLLMRMSFL